MCELFAISSARAVAVRYSLNEFAKHGGLTHLNKSGWGISFQRDEDTLLIKEPEPADDSPWVNFIAEQHVKSHCVIAHVRRASIGKPRFENTHPFKRELAGQAQVFAHNGTLAGIHEVLPLTIRRFQPIGETDSEHAFCYLLEQVAPLWDNGIPGVEERLSVVAAVADVIRRLGSANFFYSDGDTLFVHADQRIYDDDGVLSAPRAPGLHWIKRHDYLTMGLKVAATSREGNRAVLIASVPLCEGGWQGFKRGSVIAYRGGEIVGETFLAELS